MSQDCIFCKIVSGEIPGEVVYRDDKIIAFKDINPAAPVHLLVIPIEHIVNLTEVEVAHQDLLGHILIKSKEIAAEQGIAESGYRLVANTNEDGGQVVFHLHFHIIGGKPLGRFA